MQISAKNLGFGVLILLGLIIAFVPANNTQKSQIASEDLIAQVLESSIYVQADELAHWIIDKNPAYQLVDIRSNQDYTTYHIPDNIHIPFSDLNTLEAEEQLDGEKMIILASNGNTRAGQAWILLKQMGYEEVYILAGGLNNWINVFNNPQHPTGAYTDDELFTYQFRKAASGTLMGGTTIMEDGGKVETVKPKPVVRKRKKKAKQVDEGC